MWLSKIISAVEQSSRPCVSPPPVGHDRRLTELSFRALRSVVTVAIGLTWAVIAVVGTAIVTRLAPAEIRGETLGLHTAIGAIVGSLDGVLGGWAATFGYTVAFSAAGTLVLLGVGLVASLSTLSTTTRTSDPSTPSASESEGGTASVSEQQ